MKKSLLATLILLTVSFYTKADEGMWLLMHLKKMNYEDMQKKGLKLTPEEIYDINKPGLKDAVVQLGGFCTGEIISPNGLMLTNHHCGYDAIQGFSSLENDYLTNGFWAMKKEEEKPVPGLFAMFMVRMEDVTDKVLAAGANLSGSQREAAMKAKMAEIRKKATEGMHYIAEVKSFFDGNEYYLFVYEKYNDVRLVGAPPSAIGKFGGDTDNWMWPRHTGDFCLFRVYSAPDGKPADYNAANIPLKPRHYLPISLKGVQKNDYAMILGYPGKTDRYLTSYGVKQAIEIDQPARVKLRGTRLEIMKKEMDANDAIRIQYASHYAQISNYWKYFIGQTRGLKRLKVYDKKLAEEKEFQNWANTEANKNKYGNVLNNIADAYSVLNKSALAETYFQECILGIEINTLYIKLFNIYGTLKSGIKDEATLKEIVEKAKPEIDDYFKNHTSIVDKKTMVAMLTLYYNDIDKSYHPKEFTDLHKKYKGNFTKYVDEYYAKSVFTDKSKLEKALSKPELKMFEKDTWFNVLLGFITLAQGNIAAANAEAENKLTEATRLYIEGLRKMQPNRKFYPNANFTMRLTYGQVLDYYPQDAVHYNYYTTIDGIMEKEDPNNEEFVVPAKLKELYEKKDYGPYAENGVLKVAFISDNDITGGNSGSPVINAKGELIGCAFDGNWEAMSGDIAFETNLQRTISVDIRYVLFVIDKFAGAKHLIDEMTLVR
jgi:hypothetical protein